MSPQRLKVRRRFRVVEVPTKERSYKDVHQLVKVDDGAFTIKPTRVKVTERQFDVYLPLGNSVRLTESELKRYGLDGNPEFIDIDTGELIPVDDVLEEPLSNAVSA